MLKVFMLIMLSISVYLGYIVFKNENTGKQHLAKIELRLKEQETENNKLKSRNDLLELDIQSLHKNLSALEELARQEMGLIQRDETFYHIIDSKSNDKNNNNENKK